MKLKIDAHLWCLGSYAERYVPGGYFDDMELTPKSFFKNQLRYT